MLNITFDESKTIVLLEPEAPLTQNDFEAAKRLIKSYIQTKEEITGIIIHTQLFPGWEMFSALVENLKFIEEHSLSVKHVGFVSNSILEPIARQIAGHFVGARIRIFPYNQLESARKWMLNDCDA